MAFSFEVFPFDKYKNAAGEEIQVNRYVCCNNHGFQLEMLDLGARIYSFKAPSPTKDGEPEELTMQHKYLSEMIKDTGCYFGCTVGRYANRIASGTFNLDGQKYDLAKNNDGNHLHGGAIGFDQRIWETKEVITGHEVGVEFSYTSPDGEEGYPGELKVTAKYSLTSDDELVMEFSANTDKPTIVNITNHAYWNLSGKIKDENIEAHQLQLNCKQYIPVNDNMIPLGEIADVTADLNFTSSKSLDIINSIPIGGKNGLDHCFVVDRTSTPFPDDCADVGILSCGDRKLTIRSNQLGIQFYTANWLTGLDSNGKASFMKPHQAIAIEPQIFPNSPNVPRFPCPVLRPNKNYHHLSIYKFTGFPIPPVEE